MWQVAQDCIDAARAVPLPDGPPPEATAPLVARDSVWSASSYDLHRGLEVIAANDVAAADLLDQWFGRAPS